MEGLAITGGIENMNDGPLDFDRQKFELKGEAQTLNLDMFYAE